MAKNILRTGKKVRPKTAIKGKRYHCARCRKRSPKPVETPTLVLPELPEAVDGLRISVAIDQEKASCPSSNAASMVAAESSSRS